MPDWDYICGMGEEGGDPDFEIHDPSAHCAGGALPWAHRSPARLERTRDSYKRDECTRTCRHCGARNLKWRLHSGAWVLYTTSHVAHACPTRTASPDEFDAL